jgi:hypothetical protein
MTEREITEWLEVIAGLFRTVVWIVAFVALCKYVFY